MRAVLRFIGWVLVVGAVANAAMAIDALYVVGRNGFADPGISVDALISGYVPFLGWTRGTASSILPPNVVEFFFASPALVIFPLRAIVAGLLGGWALKAARRPAAA